VHFLVGEAGIRQIIDVGMQTAEPARHSQINGN
jgi:hypothetical protein